MTKRRGGERRKDESEKSQNEIRERKREREGGNVGIGERKKMEGE